MLYREVIVVFFGDPYRTHGYTNALCKHNVEFLNVKPGDT